MYDPQQSPPPSFDAAGARAAQQRRAMLIWGSIAAAGGIIIMIMSCLLVVLFVVPGLVNSPTSTTPQPAPPTADPAPATEAGPPPEAPDRNDSLAPIGRVRIDEDFDQPTERWDQSLALVRDGAYDMSIETPASETYGLFLGRADVRNFDMAVDVQQIAGPATAEYGIRFRQSGPRDYLMFSISGSGYYRLVRVSDRFYHSVVPWTFDERIATGADAVNRLRVVADGPALTAFINGNQVLAVRDDIMMPGQLTLGVQTFEQGGLAVRFDNIAGVVEDGVQLEEDFSDPEDATWSVGGARIDDGGYELLAGADLQAWQHPLPQGSSRVESFVAEVEMTLLDQGGNTSYGLIFGDNGTFDFYTLVLLADGGLSLRLNSNNQGSIALLESPLDGVDTGTNITSTLRLEVREQRLLTITVNDEQREQMELPVPVPSGMVGVFVSSGADGRAQVRFDNFSLREVIDGDPAWHPSRTYRGGSFTSSTLSSPR